MADQDHGLFGLLFFILAALVHFADALYLFDRAENLVLFGVFYGFLLGIAILQTSISPHIPPEQRKGLIGLYILATAWALGIPFVKGLLFFWIPVTVTLYLDMLITTFPAWIVLLWFTPWKTRTVEVIIAVYMIIWFSFFSIHFISTAPTVDIESLSVVGIPLQPALIDGFYMIRQVIETSVDFLLKVWDRILKLPDDILRLWEKQIKIATGDYYIGLVDQNTEKPLGVFLERFKPEEKIFYLGEEGKPVSFPIRISGTVRGQSLQIEDCNEYGANTATQPFAGEQLYTSAENCIEQQTVRLSCTVTGKKINGKIAPTAFNLFDIEGSGEGVECDVLPEQLPAFKEQKLLPKRETITVRAEFPFVTKAYLKAYFMEEQRKRAMKRANIDIFSFYKLPRQPPLAVYTGGPIMIGIGIPQELPIAVSSAGEQRSTSFGITIGNMWKGTIEKITDLRITPPQYIELLCPPYFEQNGDSWIISEQAKKRLESITTMKTFSCRIKVKDGAAHSLLGDLDAFPLVEAYFKVTAQYQYILTTDVPVKLKSGDSIKSDLGSCTTICNDPDGCVCTTECEKLFSEVEQGKNCNGEMPKPKETEKPTSKGKNARQNLITRADCGILVQTCGDYNQQECYEDICTLGCKFKPLEVLSGLTEPILKNGICEKDTESTRKEKGACPTATTINKCSDYTGLNPSLCEDNVCSLHPGNCYYDYHDGEQDGEGCKDCPADSETALCTTYADEKSCARDACRIGCSWDTSILFGTCKPKQVTGE